MVPDILYTTHLHFFICTFHEGFVSSSELLHLGCQVGVYHHYL